jgi:hypothetical protein
MGKTKKGMRKMFKHIMRGVQLRIAIATAIMLGSAPAYAVGPTANVVATPQREATYFASVTALAPGTTATDFLVLTGSATQNVAVKYVACSGAATAAGEINITAIIRTTADTGGTSTAPTIQQASPNDPAATAVIAAYTAAPTIASSGFGTVSSQHIIRPALTAPAFAGSGYLREFGTQNDKSPLLIGTASQFALNLGGSVPAGTVLNCTLEWTE